MHKIRIPDGSDDYIGITNNNVLNPTSSITIPAAKATRVFPTTVTILLKLDKEYAQDGWTLIVD